MGVIAYPCWDPGTLWHLKIIVIKQRWVWVLRSRAATNEMPWADSDLPMFSTVIRSFGPPRLKRLYQIRRWNRDVWNLMNVTPAIQGYFFQQLQLPTVRCTSRSGTVQVRHTVTFNWSTTQRDPKHLMLRSQIRSCQFPENLQWKREVYKLVKSPYLLSVSWTAVEMYTKYGGWFVLLPSR